MVPNIEARKAHIILAHRALTDAWPGLGHVIEVRAAKGLGTYFLSNIMPGDIYQIGATVPSTDQSPSGRLPIVIASTLRGSGDLRTTVVYSARLLYSGRDGNYPSGVKSGIQLLGLSLTDYLDQVRLGGFGLKSYVASIEGRDRGFGAPVSAGFRFMAGSGELPLTDPAVRGFMRFASGIPNLP